MTPPPHAAEIIDTTTIALIGMLVCLSVYVPVRVRAFVRLYTRLCPRVARIADRLSLLRN